MTSGRERCFAPVVDPAIRVLVLGSLPGRASLDATQYYAHPRNQFWRLMGEVLQLSLSELPYPDRLAALLDHHVGLWDVVQSAERAGSLDAGLKAVAYNDLRQLVLQHPQLCALAFNGQTAARAARQLHGLALACLPLPSSSPAYTLPYQNKLAQWQVLGQYL